MAQDPGFITRWSQYLGARLAAMALNVFDVDVNRRTAAALGRAWYRWDQRTDRPARGLRGRLHRAFQRAFRQRRARALGHLKHAFPEWSDGQRDRTACASFEHLLELIVEMVHTSRAVHLDNWSQRITLHNLGPCLRWLNSGRPGIMVTGHIGNWEVHGYFMAMMGYEVDAIARPIDNPLINRWLLGIREHRGMRIHTKWGALAPMQRVLQRGGMIGIVADQNAGDRGVFVPFFGQLASSYKAVAMLVQEMWRQGIEVPIMCGAAQRIGGQFRYKVKVNDVIWVKDWVDRPDPTYYITARWVRALEMLVRDCPEQYLWMHRRWKSRPRHERQGKPIPAVLRSKLESLPWMDQPLLRRLTAPPEH